MPQRVIRQKVNVANVQFVGEIGNGGNRGFIGVKARDQRHANDDFSGRRRAFQVVQMFLPSRPSTV